MVMWYGNKPNLRNIEVFRSVAYAHIRQGKHDSRFIKLVFS